MDANTKTAPEPFWIIIGAGGSERFISESDLARVGVDASLAVRDIDFGWFFKSREDAERVLRSFKIRVFERRDSVRTCRVMRDRSDFTVVPDEIELRKDLQKHKPL